MYWNRPEVGIKLLIESLVFSHAKIFSLFPYVLFVANTERSIPAHLFKF